MGFLTVTGSGAGMGPIVLAIGVAIWNAAVLALWSGAVTLGVQLAKGLV